MASQDLGPPPQELLDEFYFKFGKDTAERNSPLIVGLGAVGLVNLVEGYRQDKDVNLAAFIMRRWGTIGLREGFDVFTYRLGVTYIANLYTESINPADTPWVNTFDEELTKHLLAELFTNRSIDKRIVLGQLASNEFVLSQFLVDLTIFEDQLQKELETDDALRGMYDYLTLAKIGRASIQALDFQSLLEDPTN